MAVYSGTDQKQLLPGMGPYEGGPMSPDLIFLITTAASIAFLHTLIGPDHYLPFVALGKARGWTTRKMALVTIGCGLGHSVGSIVLGLLGIALGLALNKMEVIEGVRGDMAAWALMSFGLLYLAWGLRKAHREKAHSHFHVHADGTAHDHHHTHHSNHAHLHDETAKTSKLQIAPWSIFIIFVLGPCEPLIPLMLYPAATASAIGMTMVVGTFVLVTVATMTVIAMTVFKGLKFVPANILQRYMHAIAGGTIATCGFAIVGLGL